MRQKKKNSGLNSSTDGWKDKVHFVEFSYEDEMNISEWYSANKPGWTTSIEELLDDQWAVKISPPKSGDDWFVTGQFRGTGTPYDGHSFTVRYPDMEIGVVLLYYVITAMLADGQLDQVVDSKARAWLK